MSEHTKTDGLPERYSPPIEKIVTGKIACNACPVLCQISDGRTGACDRYANQAGALIRVDPVVFLRRTLNSQDAGLVPFDANQHWSDKLLNSNEVFVTGVGSSTTYPDYKPAPFIVSSQVAGVDMVTVVTEGIFSYCSLKVKIDTDRFLGAEQANVRCKGEVVMNSTPSKLKAKCSSASCRN